MPIVYRIEHKQRKNKTNYLNIEHYEGCYRNRSIIPPDIDITMSQLPSPHCSNWFNESKHGHMIFAFCSLELIIKWFGNSVLNELSKLGYVIALYELDRKHIVYDDRGIQCVFDYREAIPVKRSFYKESNVIPFNHEKELCYGT